MRYFLMACLAFWGTLSWAQSEQSNRLDAAADVVKDLGKIPEGIPPEMIRGAKAIVIIPNVIKAGFIVGGRFGRGVAMVRQGKRFSLPLFVTIGGGSVGFQAGVQSMDLVLLFRTQRSLNNLLKGKLTLGADANVAAGPIGRHGEATTDLSLKAEVYSYSRARGLFAGISLEGSWIAIDDEAAAAYYGKKWSRRDIINGRGILVGKEVIRLRETIEQVSKS